MRDVGDFKKELHPVLQAGQQTCLKSQAAIGSTQLFLKWLLPSLDFASSHLRFHFVSLKCTGCFSGQDPYSCFSELKQHGKILLTQTLNLHCLKTMLSTHKRERKTKTKTKTGILKEWHCKLKHLNTAKHKFLFYAKLQKSSLCIVFTGYGLWLCWESLRFLFSFFSFFFNIFFFLFFEIL